MNMTSTDIPITTTTPDDERDFSIWAHQFKLPSVKSDPLRWNKEWEKKLRTLSSSEDVYPMMSQMYKKGNWESAALSEHSRNLEAKVCSSQNVVAESWDDLEKREHFITAWLLLGEEDRKRHLLKGMEGACRTSSWRQDARALCPEITISFMLKDKGRAFLDFIRAYRKGKRDAGEDTPYLLPNEWWNKAAEDVPESVVAEHEESTFTLLTLHRNEFITLFLLHSVMSVVGDLSHGSPGMDPIINFMKASGPFAGPMGKSLYGMRKQIHCQNCTKRPEEIGPSTKFMMCSICKSKLDFAVYYCSQACQKEDWRKHKKHCGKTKVAGTDHGVLSGLPDYMRNVSVEDGGVKVTSMGFGIPKTGVKCSRALQRQQSLITGDKDADYFLFNEQDHPVRFELHDILMKMIFRNFRACILSNDMAGLAPVAQLLIKVMGQKPGLSREGILRQLEAEYGVNDLAVQLAQFERKCAEGGYSQTANTFIEATSKFVGATAPIAMGMQ